MTSDSEFDSIRPYCGAEIEAAGNRLSQSQDFLHVFPQVTGISKENLVASLKGIHDKDDFQERFFGPVIQHLIDTTTDGVSCEGMELVDKDASYIFISNHRDIILDSAILNTLLRSAGKKYTRAAIGSNLLINDWVTDLVKLNTCFVIERDVTVREMLTSSAIRSRYIRNVIQEKEDSVWIAEREGRTKDGNDRSQPSLLKMLKMSGPSNFAGNFKELHLMPVSISYEWEPCDDLKTEELYTRSVGEFVKTPEADMHSMIVGLSAFKGRVHFHVDQVTAAELEGLNALPTNGARIEALAGIIDGKIHKNFRLWPNNYIAYDLLHSVNRFADRYTPEEKERFITTMKQKMDKLEGNISLLNNIFLAIYANPVKNGLDL